MGKIPSFTDSERSKTPKTDCVLNIYKDKEFYQLALHLENSEERATLSHRSFLHWTRLSPWLMDDDAKDP